MSTDIEALLKATIQTKVIEAFNTTPEMIEKLIQAAFEKPVNEYGLTPDTRGFIRDKEMPWIEWLVGNEIRLAAQAAIKEYMADSKTDVKAKVKAAISSGSFGDKIGETIADLMAEDYRWSFSVEKNRD